MTARVSKPTRATLFHRREEGGWSEGNGGGAADAGGVDDGGMSWHSRGKFL